MRKTPHDPSSVNVSCSSPTGNISAPTLLDRKDPDNPTFQLLLVVPSDVPMTLCFAPKTALTGSFKVGSCNGFICTIAKQAICDIVVGTVSQVIPIENDVKEAFDDLVEQVHQLSSITKDSFSFGHPASTTCFAFLAVTKHMFHQDFNLSDPTIVCHPLDAFAQHICDVILSTLHCAPPSELLALLLPFLSPLIKAAFEAHLQLKSEELLPVKSFTDSLSLGNHGNWGGSVAVHTAPATLSGPHQTQFPSELLTPNDMPAGQDNGPLDDSVAQGGQGLSAHQSNPCTDGNPAQVSDITDLSRESDATTLVEQSPHLNADSSTATPSVHADTTQLNQHVQFLQTSLCEAEMCLREAVKAALSANQNLTELLNATNSTTPSSNFASLSNACSSHLTSCSHHTTNCSSCVIKSSTCQSSWQHCPKFSRSCRHHHQQF